jgi:1-deoxy-D-xylulose-5-phosphate reductoisomerase
MKEVLIFGSTGSIGKNALSVIRKNKDKFKVKGLCANKDLNTLLGQIKEFKPKYVCLRDETSAKKLASSLDKKIKLFKGPRGLDEFSSLGSDISLMAISGISCLKPLLANIKQTKMIALANKESLVTAGRIVFNRAKKFKTQIIPVDSEINALFQLINGKRNDFRKVYLTASGGSLVDCSKKDLSKVSVKQVLAHPNWKMGKRVTIDSATLVNKGFEVIETHFFFGLAYENIDILMHKESLVHALVEFKDNTVFACLYPPDMKMPISYVLHYPDRAKSSCNGNFKGSLACSFRPVDYKKYSLLELILKAAKKQDNSLVVLNAADEVAIDYFLKKKIKFTDIHKVLKYILKHNSSCPVKGVEDVFYWDRFSRAKTKEYLDKL